MIADHNDITEIKRKIAETVSAINALVPAIALARQVIEYDGDRRKQLLAKYASRFKEFSATAADTAARANPGYAEELDKLAEELCNAYEVRAKWDAFMARLDAARSLLSMEKETMNKMPEKV